MFECIRPAHSRSYSPSATLTRLPADDLVLEANLVQQAAGLTANHSLAVENLKQALPDLAGLLAGIDWLPNTGLLVVVDNRCGLGVICRKALLKCIGVVVRALDERLASDIVGHFGLGRVEDLVV